MREVCGVFTAGHWIRSHIVRGLLVAILMAAVAFVCRQATFLVRSTITRCIITWLQQQQRRPLQIADCCPECSPHDMDSVKVECQVKGHDLQDAESAQNATTVCRALHELLICVGTAVPQCLEIIGAEYEHYRWSPWDCHVSQNEVHVYQELVNNGCPPEVEIHSQLNIQDANQSASSSVNFANAIHSTVAPVVIPAILASVVLSRIINS